MKRPRILVAGIGNIFFGDDAFGVEIAQRMAAQAQPDGVTVIDFGLRGFDLACALVDGYDLAILVDAMPRGGEPGTLYVLEPELNRIDKEDVVNPHGWTPEQVVGLAQSMEGTPAPIRVVGCEPSTFGTDDDPVMGLSTAVEMAVDEAIHLINRMIVEFSAAPAAPVEKEVLS